MPPAVERVLAALGAHGCDPKPSGDGWMCRCPSHEDRTPSLSVGAGDDGRALVFCFADSACTADSITKAIGLTLSDLMPTPTQGVTVTKSHRFQRKREVSVTVTGKPANAKPVRTFATAAEAVTHLESRRGTRANFWTYTDASGVPVGVVIRWNLPQGKKDFQPVSLINGGWANKAMPEPRPLYRLVDLLQAGLNTPVFVCEGEKAADAARALGFLATTSPGGARASHKADWSPLVGRDVVILPDADPAGEGYAERVAALVHAAGARSVRVVRLSELWAEMPEGGDIVDYLEHRGGDAEAAKSEIQALAAKPESIVSQPTSSERDVRYKPFPLDCLPVGIRYFVQEAAESMNCDPACVALPLLCGLAAAIGNTCRIRLKGTWTEPAIIWGAVVAPSGQTKSPAMDAALQAVYDRQKRAMHEYRQAMIQYEAEQQLHARRLADWRNSDSSESPPAAPVEPTPDECWTGEATIEAAESMLAANPRGLLVAADELQTWFGSFNRYGGKGGKTSSDAAKWIQSFHGRQLKTNRKTGKRINFVPMASASVCGTIQPEILRMVLDQENRASGLAARLLTTFPPARRKVWNDHEVCVQTAASLAEIFDRLYSLSLVLDDTGCPRPAVLSMTPEAKALFVEFYNEHAIEQEGFGGGDLAAAWAKLEAYAPRLALLLHMVKWADRTDEAQPGLIDAETMSAAIRLTRWFAHEALRIYAMLEETEEDRELRTVQEWVARRESGVTASELAHGMRAFRSDPEGACQVLSKLVKAGRARWVSGANPQGGPRTQRCQVTPGGPLPSATD